MGPVYPGYRAGMDKLFLLEYVWVYDQLPVPVFMLNGIGKGAIVMAYQIEILELIANAYFCDLKNIDLLTLFVNRDFISIYNFIIIMPA